MKIFRKIVLSVIVLVLAFFTMENVKVFAEGESTTIPNVTSETLSVYGASLRLNTFQGIRFEARIYGEYNADNVEKYGILLAYGNIEDPTTIIPEAELNKKIVKDCNVDDLVITYVKDKDGKDTNEINYTSYFIVLYNIPNDEKSNYITARAYVKLDYNNDDASDDEIVYGSVTKARNLVDVARSAYTADPTVDTADGTNIIKQLIVNHQVRLEHSNGKRDYFADLTNVTLAEGDSLDLVRGTYNTPIEVTVDNVTITGTYEGIKGYSSSRDSNIEAVLTNAITIGDDVDNVVINGIKITGTNALILKGSQSNITLKYSYLKYSGNYGIIDVDSNGETINVTTSIHSNINLVKNYFYGDNTTSSTDIVLEGNTNNINIENNRMRNDNSNFSENNNAIVLKKAISGSLINIQDNEFRHLGANQIIDIGKGMATKTLEALINIENNAMAEKQASSLYGNGIIISKVATASNIKVLHNYNFRVSPYYNTLLITSDTRASNNYAQNPVIYIGYNVMFAAAFDVVTKPNGRTEVTTKTNNVALGFGNTQSSFEYMKNYYGSSRLNAAYETNSSATTLTGNYTKKTLYTNKADSISTAEDSYTSYIAAFDTLGKDAESYLAIEIATGTNSYYIDADNGISKIIIGFKSTYEGKLEIQNGKLVYVGTDATEYARLYKLGITKANPHA